MFVVTTQRANGAPEPGSARLEDDFGIAIGMVFRAYAKAVEAAVGDIPSGPRGYFVLSAAVQGGAGSQRALAERLGVDRTVMTYLLDDLEREGLVERRPDPADRRNRHVLATEQGVERWRRLHERVSLAERQLLEVLSEDARETFRATLCKLAGHVNAPDQAGGAGDAGAGLGGPGESGRVRRRGRGRSAT